MRYQMSKCPWSQKHTFTAVRVGILKTIEKNLYRSDLHAPFQSIPSFSQFVQLFEMRNVSQAIARVYSSSFIYMYSCSLVFGFFFARRWRRWFYWIYLLHLTICSGSVLQKIHCFSAPLQRRAAFCIITKIKRYKLQQFNRRTLLWVL